MKGMDDMYYAIVSCYIENVKMFAVYPVTARKVQSDLLIAYFVDYEHGVSFVYNCLKGKVY